MSELRCIRDARSPMPRGERLRAKVLSFDGSSAPPSLARKPVSSDWADRSRTHGRKENCFVTPASRESLRTCHRRWHMAKQDMTWWLARNRIGAVFAGVLSLLLIGGPVLAAQLAGLDLDTERSDGSPNPALFPAESHPHGFSMETWAENWWRWAFS